MKPVIWDRKTRWKQYGLLLLGLLCAGIAGFTWFLMGDDEGNPSEYTWKQQVAGCIIIIVAMVILAWLGYRWLLGWHIGVPENFWR